MGTTAATARAKGIRFERAVVNTLNAAGLAAFRNVQFRGGIVDGPDVLAVDRAKREWAIECKVGKSPPTLAALAQAQANARRGQWPIALVKRDREPPVVIMPLETYLLLLRARGGPCPAD